MLPPDESLQRNILRILGPGGAVVGTGFVAKGGVVLTCAHVVTDALGQGQNFGPTPPDGRVTAESACRRVSLTLAPERRFWGPAIREGLAEVDGDFTVLRVISGEVPEGFSLNPPQACSGDRTWCWGFPRYSGDEAGGRLKRVEFAGPDRTWPIERDGEWRREIVGGYSGAPMFLRNDKSAPIGMLVEREKNDHPDRRAFILPCSEFLSVYQAAIDVISAEAGDATALYLEEEEGEHANYRFAACYLFTPTQEAQSEGCVVVRLGGSFDRARGVGPGAPRLRSVELQVQPPSEKGANEGRLGMRKPYSTPDGIKIRASGDRRQPFWTLEAEDGALTERSLEPEDPLFSLSRVSAGDIVEALLVAYANEDFDDAPEDEDLNTAKQAVMRILRLKDLTQGDGPDEEGRVTLCRLRSVVKENSQ